MLSGMLKVRLSTQVILLMDLRIRLPVETFREPAVLLGSRVCEFSGDRDRFRPRFPIFAELSS